MFLRHFLVSLLAAGALALLAPLTALAAEVQTGDTITVGPNQVIADDLYAFGTTITIRGTVLGDVIAAGSTVTISGHVTGDVMAAGSTVIVTGPVDGSLRIAGSAVDVTAPVAGDAMMAGPTLNLRSTGRVGRDALLAGGIMDLQGPVARNVKAAGNSLTIGSSVGGSVEANVNDLTFTDGASVVGPIQRTAPAPRTNPWEVAGVDMLALVRGFVGMAAFGLLLVFAFPRAAATTATTLQRRWPASILAGFAIVLGAPVLALMIFLVGLLLGGWWISLVVLMLYAILAPVGYVACAEWLGLAALQIANRPHHTLWAMLAGLLILAVLSIVPILGGLVVMAAALFGVGGLAVSAWQAYRQPPTAAVEPVAEPEPAPAPLQAAA